MQCSYKHTPLPDEDFSDWEDNEEKCQFDNVSHDASYYIEVDGKFWCPFHCPIVDSQGDPTTKGKYSEEKIVDFNKKCIGYIQKHGDFRGVVFPGFTDFSEIIFSDSCDFSNTIFIKDVWFAHSHFKSDVHFNKSIFKDEVNFFCNPP